MSAAPGAGERTARVFYFGCIGRAGHSIYATEDGAFTSMRSLPESLPGVCEIDGELAPRVGRAEAPQGVAARHLIRGWTVLAWWDRSLDRRPKSNSAVMVEGDHDFASALDLARAAFPSVFARFTYPVVDPSREAPHAE